MYKVLLRLNNLRQVTMSSISNISKFREELQRFSNSDAVGLLGILNITPDSFYDGGANNSINQSITNASKMLSAGANIIDIGGQSSRPGAETVDEKTEWLRVEPIIKGILDKHPDTFISIDTYRAHVAHNALEQGAVLVNDISAGKIDPELHKVVASHQAPYVLMHMQGTPENMQENPSYENPTAEVLDFFKDQTAHLNSLGIQDIILDPGFGFGKRVSDNYNLLKNLDSFNSLGYPVLAGVSRKSMIYKVLGGSPSNALNGTTALNAIALQNGASLLRVHDIAEAKEVITLHEQLISA